MQEFYLNFCGITDVNEQTFPLSREVGAEK